MISISCFGVAMPLFALLLEAMQYEHGFREFHGVDGAVRATGIAFHDF
jgi:hypothetical protein